MGEGGEAENERGWSEVCSRRVTGCHVFTRDVSEAVAKERNDVLIIEGGVIEVPGDVDFHFSFGFPPKTAYACMSETMILALEGRYESFTLGKDISVERVEEITRLADKHGFKLAGFRSFERAVTDEKIAEIRKNAGRS